MTTDAPVRDAYAQRHAIHADRQTARVARDTIRGKLVQLAGETRRAEALLRECEAEMVLNVDGATERRDGALEVLQTAERATEDAERGLRAADEVIQAREAQLERLYAEQLGAFVREAEAHAAGALTDLKRAQRAVAVAVGSWARARAAWGPLNGPLRRMLEELDAAEGRIGNPAGEARVGEFPVEMPGAVSAPRPSGIDRLRAAGKL